MISATGLPTGRGRGGRGFSSTDLHQDGKSLLKPDCDVADPAEQEGKARQHEEDAHNLLDRAEMLTEAGQEAHEGPGKACSNPEGYGKAERIDG